MGRGHRVHPGTVQMAEWIWAENLTGNAGSSQGVCNGEWKGRQGCQKAAIMFQSVDGNKMMHWRTRLLGPTTPAGEPEEASPTSGEAGQWTGSSSHCLGLGSETTNSRIEPHGCGLYSTSNAKENVFHSKMRRAVRLFTPAAKILPHCLLNTFIFLQSDSDLSLLNFSGHWEVILICFTFAIIGIYFYLYPCFFIPVSILPVVVVDPEAHDLWFGDIWRNRCYRICHHSSSWFLRNGLSLQT